MKLLSAIACGALLSIPAVAMATDLAPLDVPAKALPAPTADISPGMQAFVGAPLNPNWNKLWKTGEEARVFADKQAADTVKTIPDLLARQHVKSEASTIGGVRVYILTPDDIPPENKDKVLIHVHGGCYVLFPGESGTPEGIIMAGDGHYKVISVDYRMPPEAYFPAAVDDAVTVYKAVLKDTPAKNIGVFGTSAGGALTLELVLRAREQVCLRQELSRRARQCQTPPRPATASIRTRRSTTFSCPAMDSAMRRPSFTPADTTSRIR